MLLVFVFLDRQRARRQPRQAIIREIQLHAQIAEERRIPLVFVLSLEEMALQ